MIYCSFILMSSLNFCQDSWYQIYTQLAAAGAKYGAHLKEHGPQLNEEEEADKINGYIPTIAIVAALLVTVSFTCAFSVPGGYRAGDDQHKLARQFLPRTTFFWGSSWPTILHCFALAFPLSASCMLD